MTGRSTDNRLEPECWPNVEPGFHFTRDQVFFAIGSCFAKNIAKRLVLDGYTVHGGVVSEGNRRNRYTPPAIYQELAWAKRIFDRDDTPADEDILPLLLELGPNRWTDIWSRPERGTAATIEQAIEARRQLYGYFRGAFVADVVIITLGLVEAWWDEISRSYVEFDTSWARRPDKERFRFERLGFVECRDYLEKTLDLILGGERRALVTTSPVVLARTFTGDDIIIANSHSKSVLRAVAGEVSSSRSDVDYFPSYEIATLTRRPEVWSDDLIHINPDFVARIMQHVTSAYVPGSVSDDDRLTMQMANLVEAWRFGDAQALYDGLEGRLDSSAGPAANVAAMRLAAHNDDRERAARHAANVDGEQSALYINHPDWMFDVAYSLRQIGDHRAAGDRIAERLWQACSERPFLFQPIFVMSARAGDAQAIGELCDRILSSQVSDAIVTHKIAAHLQNIGRLDDSAALCHRQLRATPGHPLILTRLARLDLAGKDFAAAVERLRALIDVDPENHWARMTLARTLLSIGRAEESLAIIDAVLQATPGDASALTVRARAYWKLKQSGLARQAARSAIETGAISNELRRQLQPILQSATD